MDDEIGEKRKNLRKKTEKKGKKKETEKIYIRIK